MTRPEFEEFYKYITCFNTTEIEGENKEEVKETYWKSLDNVSFGMAMKKAKEIYRFLIPCNLNLLNPKVFSGEVPNPGLFGRPEKEERFYM